MNNDLSKTVKLSYVNYFAKVNAGGITKDSLGLIHDFQRLSMNSKNFQFSCFNLQNSVLLRILRMFNYQSKFPNTDKGFLWIEQASPIPSTLSGRVILRVHDIFPLTDPGWFRVGTKNRFSHNLKRILKLDPILVFNSNSTLLEFVKKFPSHLSSLFVIWCKPDITFKKICGKCTGCNLLSTSTFNENYCLMVGTIEPRKNYSLLLRMLNLDCSSKLKFIIIGRYGWKQRFILAKLERFHSKQILVLRDVCDGSRLEITKNAKVFMSTSHNEGFGMPVAEARALGVNLVLGDIPVYREIHGTGPNIIYVGLEAKPVVWLEAVLQSIQVTRMGNSKWYQDFMIRRENQITFFLSGLQKDLADIL
jgi:glycosyltransferase involved in cell wall biosynthesis